MGQYVLTHLPTTMSTVLTKSSIYVQPYPYVCTRLGDILPHRRLFRRKHERLFSIYDPKINHHGHNIHLCWTLSSIVLLRKDRPSNLVRLSLLTGSVESDGYSLIGHVHILASNQPGERFVYYHRMLRWDSGTLAGTQTARGQ
jgi:hypothetical protein